MTEKPFTHDADKLQLILDSLTLQELKIVEKINQGGTTDERQGLRDRLKRVRELFEEVGHYKQDYLSHQSGIEYLESLGNDILKDLGRDDLEYRVSYEGEQE